MKNTSLIIVGVLVLGGLFVWMGLASRAPLEHDSNVSNVVSAQGIHWHPKLIIRVDDTEVTIPTNIGLIGGHSPIHTHAEDVAQGVLHFEFEGVVRTNDLKLQNFFTIWGNKDIATAFGVLERMTVNGQESTAWGEYIVQNEDTIELFYKSALE